LTRGIDALGRAGDALDLAEQEARYVEDVDADIHDGEAAVFGEIGLVRCKRPNRGGTTRGRRTGVPTRPDSMALRTAISGTASGNSRAP
jgi:hypothetical protein